MNGQPRRGIMRSANTEAALDRLGRAVGRLSAVLIVQREALSDMAALADDRARLERDRVALADELSNAQARAARLLEANATVAKRLVSVMEDVRRWQSAPEDV